MSAPSALALPLRLSWITLNRDWRSGELKLVAASVIIAVAALSAVGFFTDRMAQAMARQANALLGGDLAVDSADPLPSAFFDAATRYRLRTARTLSFRSAVSTDSALELTELKAVDAAYPLRGQVHIADAPFAPGAAVRRIPARGTVWVEPRLLHAMGLQVGDALQVGAVSLTIAAVLVLEPDRGGQLFSIAPRILMNLADIPASRLVEPASRVRYRLLLAGEPSDLARYRAAVADHLVPGIKLRETRDARPELNSALRRAEQFLGLAALIGVITAAVAIAIAARRYALRHLDNCAIMRCVGASQQLIDRVFFLTLCWLSVATGVIGVAAGFLAQEMLAEILAELNPGALPAPGLRPALNGMLCALTLLIGFALPPLAQLKRVPPARVLQGHLQPPSTRSVLPYVASLLLVYLLSPSQMTEPRLAAYVFGGCLGALAVLAGSAYAAVKLLDRLRGRVGVAWRFGLANIARRPRDTVVQIIAIGVGITVLLLLAIVRADLLTGWRESLPDGAPNQFAINIQPDEVDAIGEFFSRHGREAPAMFPMVRARLTHHNGRPVDPDDYQDPRARRLADREFNLSWAARLQSDNRLVAGTWWDPQTADTRQLSFESEIAERLGIALGDELTYRIADRSLSARVTSLREVQWDSFNVNFFVLTPPGLLDSYPATYITAFYLPRAELRFLNALVRAFPSVTIIDVDAVLTQVRRIMDRVTLAVEFVFGFTLLAGMMVLLAAVHASRDERVRESALLKTLGASRARIRAGLAAEFLILGLVSGGVAAGAAALIGHVLAGQVFGIDLDLNPLLLPCGLLAGVLGVAGAGVLGMRGVLNSPPVVALRQV